MIVRRAGEADLPAISRIQAEARRWLAEIGSDQWQKACVVVGGSPESVCDAAGNEDEGPGPDRADGAVEIELRGPVQDPERLRDSDDDAQAASSTAGTRRSCRENAPPVVAATALNSKTLPRAL
jgi:hypothetical protein